MPVVFAFAAIIVGFGGIIAQVLLLREFLVIFQGNELSIGIILSNWLLSEGFGAHFIGKKIENAKNKIETFVITLLLFSIFFFLAIYFIRILKAILGIPPGEGIDLFTILYSSGIILFPVSALHGALFTFSCKIYSSFSKDFASSIGKVYIYETLGTLIGGVMFTFVFLTYFNSYKISFFIMLISSLLGIILLILSQQGRKFFSFFCLGISVIFFILSCYFVFGKIGDKLHITSIKKQFEKYNVLHYRNSIYGNIIVVKDKEQYTFFYNGLPAVTLPTPDIVCIEEFVHLTLLSHNNPQDIAVISGGIGGVINEIAKYPTVSKIDYCELDPELIYTIKKFPTKISEKEIATQQLNINYQDGRNFITKTKNKYDIVLIGISNLSNLQTNRFFTYEFFSLVKNTLKNNGILAITLPGSLVYLPLELKKLNTCVLKTLESVFPYVQIIPGDFNIFLASSSPQIMEISPEKLYKNLKAQKIKTSLITLHHIEYKLQKRWKDWFIKSTEEIKKEIKINYDFSPSGVFYSISLWNAMFTPKIKPFFNSFEKINIKLLFALLFGIILILFTIQRYLHTTGLLCTVATTGFAGMVFDIILIFVFQIIYGYVYYWITLLIVSLMVGITVGGFLTTLYLEKIKNHFSLLLVIEIIIIIFSLLLPLIFHNISPHFNELILKAIFLILSFTSGILIGGEFPLFGKIYLKHSPNVSYASGLIYALDLFGGFFGGIIGSIILLPILGLFHTCLFLAVLKTGGFIILRMSRKKI